MSRYILASVVMICSLHTLCSNAWADEAMTLIIDSRTGEGKLRNESPSSIELDSYLVTSSVEPTLNVQGWRGLADSAVPGWTKTPTTQSNRLGEANLFGSLTVKGGGTVDLGRLYQPFTPTSFGQAEPGLSTMKLSYTLANGSQSQLGDVEFAQRNTIVMVVDRGTGAASLVNQSGFSVNLDGYLLKSISGGLQPTNWAPLSSTTAGWVSSAGVATRIGEGNLLSSTTLAPNGGSLSIGRPIDLSKVLNEEDIALEFSVAGLGVFTGGVQFSAPIPMLRGDYDSDFDVDSQDLLFFLSVWTGALDIGNPDVAAPRGDLTGDLDVDSDDLLEFLSSWTGALNADGSLGLFAESPSLRFSHNGFAAIADGTRVSPVVTVPEPNAALSVLVCCVAISGTLRKRQ